MGRRMLHAKDAYALNRPGAKVTMRLAPNHRFVIVIAGVSPKLIPISEEGNWEIDIPPELLPSVTEWPVLVVMLRKKHADLYAKMSPEMATDLVRQARATYSSAMQ